MDQARPDDLDNVQIYSQAFLTSGALFGAGADKVWYSDPYFQKLESYVFSFAAGKAGAPFVINNEYGNGGEFFLLHTSDDLANNVIEAPVLFYELLGSYFGDWNLENDIMRATIATPQYGLAAMWSRYSRWRFYPLVMGLPLGHCLLSTVNDNDTNGTLSYEDRSRYLSILGDPTLRLHTIEPPRNFQGTVQADGSVRLEWLEGQNETGCKYYVYRAPSLTGAFQVISGGAPIEQLSITDTNPVNPRIYMVRAVKDVTSDRGSYQNISQGAFWPEP